MTVDRLSFMVATMCLLNACSSLPGTQGMRFDFLDAVIHDLQRRCHRSTV